MALLNSRSLTPDTKLLLNRIGRSVLVVAGFISTLATYLPVMRFLNPYLRLVTVALLVFGIFRGAVSALREKDSQLVALKTEHQRTLEKSAAEKDVEVARLTQRIAALSRKPYNEDLERCAKQALDQMSLGGAHMLRQLLLNERIEVGRAVLDFPVPEVNEQMTIALRSGVVRQATDRHGGMSWNFWELNPEFRRVLQDVLYEPNRL